MSIKNTNLKLFLNQLEDILDLYMVEKAPFSIPENIKKLIVDLGPYFVILGIILGLPTVLAVFGLGALFSPFTTFLGPSYMITYGINYVISMIIYGAALVFQALAIPGLFQRQRKGWLYLFYASLVSLVSGVLGGNLIGTLVGSIIGWYVLFQVREYYK